MLIGFNTDFRFQGKLFHVQTEDNGVQNPVIVTLLYHGGTILASRKLSYADIIKYEKLETVVRDLMENQHKQIIRDLVSGKVSTASIDGLAPVTAADPAWVDERSAEAVPDLSGSITIKAKAPSPGADTRPSGSHASADARPEPPAPVEETAVQDDLDQQVEIIEDSGEVMETDAEAEAETAADKRTDSRDGDAGLKPSEKKVAGFIPADRSKLARLGAFSRQPASPITASKPDQTSPTRPPAAPRKVENKRDVTLDEELQKQKGMDDALLNYLSKDEGKK